MANLIGLSVVTAIMLLGSPVNAGSYPIQNTFNRSGWVKENCAKLRGGLISYRELAIRLDVPSRRPDGQHSFAAQQLCRVYGAW